MIEYGDDAIVLDCGITFPDAEMFGVDLVLPNFGYLREIRHKLRAFVITHGHEDHIGALPYALREFDLPIYGSRLTLGLVGVKLEEPGLRKQADLRVVKARETVTIGPFPLPVLPRLPQHPGRHGPGHPHARRDHRAYRRLQDRPHTGGWHPAGLSDPGPPGG